MGGVADGSQPALSPPPLTSKGLIPLVGAPARRPSAPNRRGHPVAQDRAATDRRWRRIPDPGVGVGVGAAPHIPDPHPICGKKGGVCNGK